ncbi:MAG: PKD domain-containing protein [Kiritimatiellae bacterium]|nr:PKD domain-containing protein [Kiritimatiellia bacterium]
MIDNTVRAHMGGAILRLVCVTVLGFWRVDSRAATLALEAGDHFALVDLNIGDTLAFTLQNRETRVIRVADRGTDVYTDFGRKEWTIWAEFEFEGHVCRLNYSPFRMKALYEPLNVNGVRLGLDNVNNIETATGCDMVLASPPSKHVRFWVNDATLPTLPACHLWFDLHQDRSGEIPTSYALQTVWPHNPDYRIRQDRDIHPSSYLIDTSPKNSSSSQPPYKTGWLGCWPYTTSEIHSGIDIQMPIGVNLYSIVDGSTMNGLSGSSGLARYTHDNGSTKWTFANYHCSQAVASTGSTMHSGDVYARSGSAGAGIPHAHAYIALAGVTINPWLAVWQGLENRKARDGFIRAAIAPVGPKDTGQPITFDGAASRPCAGRQIESRQWYFDDGAASTSSCPTRSFADPGLHQAILVIEDGYMRDLDEVFFSVGTPAAEKEPALTLEPFVNSASSPTPLLPEVGTDVTYSVRALGQDGHALAYLWHFSDRTTLTGRTVVHRVGEAGRHVAVVHIRDTVNNRGRLAWYVLDTRQWPEAQAPDRVAPAAPTGLCLSLR